MAINRQLKRKYRHKRIRKKSIGTGDKPRLCVYRSLKNLSVQIVDDSKGTVLFGMSTLTKDIRGKIKTGGNIEAATQLGQAFAVKAQENGIKKVCFDRGGYLYHGRVKAFAQAAREGGLEF